jgi:DNA invertase Pin-like site-specific DNA recombinase
VLVVTGGGRSEQARQAVAAGMAAARDRGVRLGRPEAPLPEAGPLIEQLRGQGLSLAAIAAALNAEGSLSPTGKPWTKGSVWHAVRRIQQQVDADGR